MTQYACYASKQICAIRAARLGDNCAVVPGANNGFASMGVLTINATLEKETGQEYMVKNGCGDIMHYSQDSDRIKKINISVEMTGFDFEALEILTGNELILDSEGTVVGMSDQGINATSSNGAYLEFWSKTIEGSDVCGDGVGEGFSHFRTVLPRVTLTQDDMTYENNIATVKLSGYAFANPTIDVPGPFNDYPVVGPLNTDAPRHIFGDPEGPPALGCGYVTVPAASS